MGMSYECKQRIFSTLLGKASNVSIASNSYIGLSTTVPTISLSGDKYDVINFTEPSGESGYSRPLIGNYQAPTSQKFGYDNRGNVSNTDIIYFPEATESWGNVLYFGIFSTQTGGVPLVWGELTAPVEVPANYVPLFRVGSLKMSFE